MTNPLIQHELEVLIQENKELSNRVLELVKDNQKLKEQVEALCRLCGAYNTPG